MIRLLQKKNVFLNFVVCLWQQPRKKRLDVFAFSANMSIFASTYFLHGKCSLFSSDERRKFERREDRRTSCRVAYIRRSVGCIGVGLLLILSSRFPTTSLTKMSFGTTLSVYSNRIKTRRAGAETTNKHLFHYER